MIQIITIINPQFFSTFNFIRSVWRDFKDKQQLQIISSRFKNVDVQSRLYTNAYSLSSSATFNNFDFYLQLVKVNFELLWFFLIIHEEISILHYLWSHLNFDKVFFSILGLQVAFIETSFSNDASDLFPIVYWWWWLVSLNKHKRRRFKSCSVA